MNRLIQWSGIFVFLLLFTNPRIVSAKVYPTDFFRWPVEHKVRLSGTFGELRPNHFHGGLDIKSKSGSAGDKLLAAGEGYVYRISVHESGYGHALYIMHPNGYVTVYGHMKKFNKALSEYVKSKQYEAESFRQNLFPPKDLFPVSRGDLIGYMGNTGSSGGAHLHFEIREAKTEAQLNPLLFGLNVGDHLPPSLRQLKVYNFASDNSMLGSSVFQLKKVGNSYAIEGDTLLLKGDMLGLALKAYDKQDNSRHLNGIYALEMKVGGELVHSFSMDKIDIASTRYINAHLDYKEQIEKKSYFNRCFRLPGNKLDIYKGGKGNGVIANSKRALKVEFLVKDINGNISKLSFWVKRAPVQKSLSKKALAYDYYLYHNQANLIVEDDCQIYFPEGTLYQDEMMHLSLSGNKEKGIYSKTLHLGKYTEPLHKYINIALRWEGPETKREKAFIGACDARGRITHCGGEWKDSFLMASVRDFGQYAIYIDEQAPTIKPIVMRSDMRKYSKIKFSIKDNLRTARNVEGLTYRCEIDGNWVLMEYDKKYNLIYHRFDGSLKKGKHNLKLIVWDAVGNQSIFEKTFIK